MPRVALYALDPALPVLLRPDGAVQVGWDTRRAVLIRPPGGLAAAELATLLRSMRSPAPMRELQQQALDHGLRDADRLTDLVAHLVVRVRDGTGLVGPLVIPGVTSCLSWH